jgi:hypothetical protein
VNEADHLQVLDTDKIKQATAGPVLANAAHGTFDNDVDVINRTLLRITKAKKLVLPVEDLRGF